MDVRCPHVPQLLRLNVCPISCVIVSRRVEKILGAKIDRSVNRPVAVIRSARDRAARDFMNVAGVAGTGPDWRLRRHHGEALKNHARAVRSPLGIPGFKCLAHSVPLIRRKVSLLELDRHLGVLRLVCVRWVERVGAVAAGLRDGLDCGHQPHVAGRKNEQGEGRGGAE